MSDKKSKFFDLLVIQVAAGSTVSKACEAVGCSNSNGYKITASKDFKAEVHRIRSEFVSAATGELASACSDAIGVIVDLSKNAEDERVKLRAATTVLDRFAKLSEHYELRERIEALESNGAEE